MYNLIGDSQTDTAKEYCLSKSLEMPDLKLFMKNPSNKANVLEFIATSECDDSHCLKDDPGFILGGKKNKNEWETLFVNSSSVLVMELSYEEPDTRIIAHLVDCVEHLRQTRALIYATDTDIIVLSMDYFCHIRTL